MPAASNFAPHAALGFGHPGCLLLVTCLPPNVRCPDDIPQALWPVVAIQAAVIPGSEARRLRSPGIFAAIQGVKNVIVHLYNSTSTLQRRVVFRMDMKETIELAASGARLINKLAKEFGSETNIIHEYSPESFTGTELEFSREICEAVMDVHKPTPEKQLILNLPATVEMATPNVYA